MIGTLVGDVVGSAYERPNIKGYSLPLTTNISSFTDDTLVNIAVADSLMNKKPFDASLREWVNKYKDFGFSDRFLNWIDDSLAPSDSISNGGCVRATAVGWFATTPSEALELAEAACKVSHNSPEAITGAKAIALTIYCAKIGKGKSYISSMLEKAFNYKFDYDIKHLHESYDFCVEANSCVPIAIFLAFNSKDFEDCMRKGLYVGGDTDSILAMAGAIRQAMGDEIPKELIEFSENKLKINAPDAFQIYATFIERYC